VGVQIVFSSNRDSFFNSEIYGMRADGTGVVRLTNHAAQDFAPALSPDKTRILFTSTRDNNRTEIFVMNANGSNVRRLTTNSTCEGIASWSPDGTKIVFTSTRDGNFEIYTMNATDGEQCGQTDQPLSRRPVPDVVAR
jgi:Tol biopolymer transport system component